MNTIFLKLFGSVLFLFLIVLLPLGFVVQQIFSTYNESHLQEETAELAQQQADLLPLLDERRLGLLVDALSENTAREIALAGANGEIETSSGVEEFSPAALGAEGTYQDEASGREYYYAEAEAASNSFDVTSVYVFSPKHLLGGSMNELLLALIWAGTGSILLALGFTFIAARRLTSPLRSMEKAARQMATGNLNVQVPASSKDELGSLARSMNELARDLKQFRNTRREFLSNVSHELRTPLSYVQGYSRALKEGWYRSEEEKQQYVHLIHDESHRMTRLINDVFELSKMEEDRFPLAWELVQIEEIAEAAVQKIKPRARQKGIDVSFDADPDLPAAAADPMRVEQIFSNILQNAVTYTHEGHIDVTLSRQNKQIWCRFSDTGTGIDEEHLPYIFERFYRTDKSRSRAHGGSGLGLAIARELTELHHGSISVQSRTGQGTSFLIQIPAAEEEEE
ncbi:signal transduction histidine kinase [Sinobaca qinghaiensis]|uniref:histidine kinase n=1 Tax=Sinobaca qinghaiensis TaxID=342944 RepID=A0A419V875_9BACL|nr:HAMP domain-containing sensor histidine kinase [Sinobaca qinghaiensis]RKD76257.1 signal transduction histidine kinase [Sinobaca qinghaiensis]